MLPLIPLVAYTTFAAAPPAIEISTIALYTLGAGAGAGSGYCLWRHWHEIVLWCSSYTNSPPVVMPEHDPINQHVNSIQEMKSNVVQMDVEVAQIRDAKTTILSEVREHSSKALELEESMLKVASIAEQATKTFESLLTNLTAASSDELVKLLVLLDGIKQSLTGDQIKIIQAYIATKKENQSLKEVNQMQCMMISKFEKIHIYLQQKLMQAEAQLHDSQGVNPSRSFN